MPDYEKWMDQNLWGEVIKRKIPRPDGGNRAWLINILEIDDEYNRQRDWVMTISSFNCMLWTLLIILGVNSEILTVTILGVGGLIATGTMWVLAALNMRRIAMLRASAPKTSDKT